MRTQVWSCGGGTQSAAIAALIVQGKLPKPDLAVIVDTEREKSGTWKYVEDVLIPELREVGVELHRVRKSAFAYVDLYSHKGLLLLPAFSTQDGKRGKLQNYCSGEWKRDVTMRWLRSLGVKQCDTWIGISLDEMRRMRMSRVQWAQNRYPLIEPEFGIQFRREQCVQEVLSLGWPKPPRSACWMCPNMGDSEWLEMQREFPEDFARAVRFERDMRERDPDAWLHESRIPLDQVQFREKGEGYDERACASGMCFV